MSVISGQAKLFTQVVGTGDPVVFLHANVCDSRMWQKQIEELARTHKTIAYDRRGFGETRAQEEEHSAVDDLIAVLDAEADGKPVILVGCSQGGRIAIDAALHHPARVRALVLVSPSVTGAPDPVFPADIGALMAELKNAEQAGDNTNVNTMKARLFLDGPLGPEGRVTGAPRELFLEMHDIALRSPPTGQDMGALPNYRRVEEIEVPALVIWGDLDLPHVQERSRHVASGIRNCEAHVMSGSGHLPSMDNSDAVTELFGSFVRRCPGG